MNTDQGGQEELTELIASLKNFGNVLMRGTQRKAVRTLMKELNLMMKAIPPEAFATPQMGVLLALSISFQEQISDIEERLNSLEENLETLQKRLEERSS